MKKKLQKSLSKLLIFFIFLFLISSSTVSAEQAAAEQYRQMFKNGNFYVEYKLTEFYPKINFNTPFESITKQLREQRVYESDQSGWGWLFGHKHEDNFKFIAGQNGKRIKSTLKSKFPAAMYQDGKYYRCWIDFSVKPKKNKYPQKMIVLSESEINSPFLNPYQQWKDIKKDLSLPEELAVFYWDEPYRKDLDKTSAPKYNGSSTRTIDKQDYECDQYVSYISSLTNSNIAMEAYNMLYQNGQLVKIQKYFIRNGKETLVSEMDIKTISSQVPESAFAIKKKVKVYAGNIGDMNDLLEKEVLVETMGGND